MTTFKELGLNPEIIKGLTDLGFTEPSPIQGKAIPHIMDTKKDLVALAQTGTGKTAAFSLPILNQISTNNKDLQAIILCPTRELCLQISSDIKNYSKYLKGISITPVYGGERIDMQIGSLKRGTNIVVGTPGRVHDLIRRKVLRLQDIRWVVLDEADEMLDMGFKDDLDAILETTPKTRQTLLFSATMSKNVSNIAMKYMTDSYEISMGEKNIGAKNVTHEYYVVQARDRFEALKRILDSLPDVYGILFCRTRRETQEIADKLKQANYDTEALHGDIAQAVRTKIMDRFKKRHVRLLVATDVAARGIDVNDLTHVVNYNLPDQNESYTHRSGRTGRAQKSGVSVSIIGPRDSRRITEIEKIIGKKFELKKIPTGKDIFDSQMETFVGQIEKEVSETALPEKYYQEFADKLNKLNKEVLIKHIIDLKFGHIINSYKNAVDINTDSRDSKTKRDDTNSVALKINFGKKHGLDIKGIFGLINSSRNLKGVEVGKISLMPEYSVFLVEKERASEIKDSLANTRYRGKNINVTIVDTASVEKTNYSRDRFSGQRRDNKSNSSFGGQSNRKKRGNFRKSR